MVTLASMLGPELFPVRIISLLDMWRTVLLDDRLPPERKRPNKQFVFEEEQRQQE